MRNDKDEATNTNYDDIEKYAKRRQSKYTENKDAVDQEAAEHLTNSNANHYKNNRIHNKIMLDDPLNKREVALEDSNVQGEMLFGTQERARQLNKNYLNSEPLESDQRSSKYNSQMQSENNDMLQCKSRESDHLYFSRDRRETKDSNVDSESKIEASKESDKNPNEDEETAIRRHIKKLSSDELEELLSSLSEDKRKLLKTIIDDTDLTVNINDNVNKREITKKAGAVEENSCIESGQAELSNNQGDVSAVDTSTEAAAQSSEANKQTDSQSENTVLSNSKTIETNSVNKAGLINQSDDSVHQKSDAEASDIVAKKTEAQIVPSEQVTSKTENKRESNLDDLADFVSFEDPKLISNDWLTKDSKDQHGYVCSQDEDLSQFLDNEEANANDGSKIYKRDLEQQADYDAKIKSLEESFPKSANYDESAGPLIRVKRMNKPAMKKRSAAVLPDAKVAYFPYRAENDDEDNDEGNEFDDDGFYDRAPNFSSNEANKPIRDASNCKLMDVDRRVLSKDMSKGTMSLGSDTDSVLSGVEGVDENLMFSSGSRNRRTTEDISDVMNESNSIHNSKSLSDETKAISDINALTYQESDSFGPLPRNNEGESGRYKRIRRVKQSVTEGDSSDS